MKEMVCIVFQHQCLQLLFGRNCDFWCVMVDMLTSSVEGFEFIPYTYGHKTFKHECVLVLEKKINQNTVSNKYSVLIGQFCSMSMKAWSDQTKVYKVEICCFSSKHVAVMSQSKD